MKHVIQPKIGKRSAEPILSLSNENDTDDEDATVLSGNATIPSVVRQNNCIYFHADVTTESVMRLILSLGEAAEFLNNRKLPVILNETQQQHKIYLYIRSNGGEVYAGISAMSHIRNSHVPVVTIVDGFVASAGTFLLLGGKERRMCSNSKVLIHQIRTGFWGKYSDLLDEVKNTRDLMKTIKRIYKSNTSLDVDSINNLLNAELTLNAKQCVKANIVHVIT